MPHFTASDGACIFFEDIGSGRPLVLLHGLTANSRLFDAQVAALSDDFRLICPDFRGHGATPAAGSLTIERLAADVSELVRDLDVAQAIGVGWSLGAMVLWKVLAGPGAARFDGAVVIDMTARVANDEQWQLGLLDPERRAPRPDESWEQRCSRIAAAVVAEDMEAERRALIDRMAREMATCDPEAVATLGQSMMEQDFREALASIDTPTLIAYGARSQYYPSETSAFLADALPNGRRVGFEHSGHSLHLEEPDAFNRMIVDFARSLPRVRDIQTAS